MGGDGEDTPCVGCDDIADHGENPELIDQGDER